MRIPSSSLVVLFLLGCGGDEDAPKEEPGTVEGTSAGDCSDGADNDADGDFDCNDAGCAGSPDCEATEENAAPSGAAIAIEPATPVDEDDLRCVVVTQATDPNGDAVAYRYAWSKNGADAGLASDTVAAALTTGGDTWTCTVTPTDGTLDGVAASATVSITQGNRAPSAPTVSITPAAPTDEDVLTCVIDTESVDPDGDTVMYAYTWSVNGADSGITGASVNAALTEAGQEWTCSVTASDGELSSSVASVSVEVASACVPAVDFGGVAYASIPRFEGFDLGTRHTMSGWVQQSSVYTNDAFTTLFLTDGITGRYCGSTNVTLSINGPVVDEYSGTSGTRCGPTYPNTVYMGETLPLLTWTHLTITVADGVVVFYRDGEMVGTGSLPSAVNPYTPFNDILMAGDPASGRYFDGALSDIAYWDRALSQAEVQTLMTDGPSAVSATDMVGWWPLNEGTGATLRDASGVAADATLMGAATWTERCP